AASVGLSEGAFESVGPLVSLGAPAEAKRRFREAGPVGTVASTFGRSAYAQALRRGEKAVGAEDVLYVLAGDPEGVSCVLVSPRPVRKRIGKAQKIALAYLAAHVATAHRLRRRGSPS